jgi:histone H3/H4
MAGTAKSLWNPENVRDVAESVGIGSLPNNIVDEVARDVDYRVAQVLEEALKFMRHSKRTTLSTQDVANALRVLNVEPLYGYESTRPLRFGEASLGPGQPLYYVEDEEVDFEKLINQSLPKVPREITFTGSPPQPCPYPVDVDYLADLLKRTGLLSRASSPLSPRTQRQQTMPTCCRRAPTRMRISLLPTA